MQAFNRFLNKNKLGLLLGGLFFLVGLATINDYGLTWDTSYHFWSGEVVVDFLSGRRGDLADLLFYSPALDAIGFVVRKKLANNLGLLAPDAAFHLTLITIASLGLFLFFIFVSQVFARKIALISTLFLATYPRFFGHAHQNFKDIPSAVMFMATLVVAYFTFLKPSWSWIFLTGVVLGLALATKVNAVFIPVILVLWRLIEVAKKKNRRQSFAQEISLWLKFLPAGLIAISVWFILSPNFWFDPITTAQGAMRHFRTTWLGNPVLFLGQTYSSGVNVPAHYAATYLTLVTPLPMLAAAILGVFLALKKAKEVPIYSLLLVWLAFPLAKYIYPRFILYDDIRQFLEVVFPLAALAAIGVVETASWLKTRLKVIPSRLLLPLLTTLALLPSLFALVRYHPYQIAYFNGLIGGAAGAQGKFDLDFWATTIKEMTLWVNQHAGPGETVNAVLGNHIVPYYLRPDLSIVYDSLEKPNYLLVVNRQSFLAPEAASYLADKEPVYVIIRDGADLGWIYRN